MASDLISRSAVINLLCNLHIDNIAVNDKKVTEYIRELPTAYDVDAVIKELEEYRDMVTIQARGFVKTAINIVKDGGKNENR